MILARAASKEEEEEEGEEEFVNAKLSQKEEELISGLSEEEQEATIAKNNASILKLNSHLQNLDAKGSQILLSSLLMKILRQARRNDQLQADLSSRRLLLCLLKLAKRCSQILSAIDSYQEQGNILETVENFNLIQVRKIGRCEI